MILPHRPRRSPSPDPCESLLAPRPYLPGSSFSSLSRSPLATCSLTPFFATDPKKRLLSPMIATLPKKPGNNPCVCHTSETPRGVGLSHSSNSRQLSTASIYPLSFHILAHSFVQRTSRICLSFNHLRTLFLATEGMGGMLCLSPLPYSLSPFFPHSFPKTPGCGGIPHSSNFQLSTFNFQLGRPSC